MVIDWHFYNVQKRKIDDVLLEHVGLPHVLPLTVHLDLDTWNTFPTLRGTWAFCLSHVGPLRPSKSYGVGWWPIRPFGSAGLFSYHA